MKVAVFILTILAISFSGCKKSNLPVNEKKFQLAIKQDIRFISRMNNEVIIGGGNNGSAGFLARSNEDITRFEIIQDSFPAPVYAGIFFKERYVFTNSKAEIFYSYSLNQFYPHWLKEENFVPTLHQQPGRCIMPLPDTSALFIASGGEFEYGLIQEMRDEFITWKPTTFTNELRCIHFTADGTGWAGGHGILIRSKDDGNSWERIEFNHISISDIRFVNNKNGCLSTIDGNFYYSANSGNDWKKAKLNGKKGYVNKLAYLDENKIVAIGNHGTLCLSNDGGKNWDCSKGFNEMNLYDMLIVSPTEIIATGEKGTFWHIDI